ncbi:MAG: hypothetical protein WA975_04975 [Mesorhizobium sp.]
MSGPRDLRRGSKPYERPADPAEVIGAKSHFIVERWGNGFAISVKRRGQPLETILCETPGQVNQHRQKLSAEGLIGYVGGQRS